MDVREPFSRLKKKIKHRLTGNKHKQSKARADVSGERVDATGSLPRSVPHVLVGGGHDQEGDGANAVGEQDFSTNRPPQPDEPESVPGGESEHDQEGEETDVDGREDSRMYSVGSGSGQGGNDVDGGKVEQIYPSASTPPFVHSGKPDGMWTWPY